MAKPKRRVQRHRSDDPPSIFGLLSEHVSRGQKILAFLISAAVVGGGLAYFERTYGPVGATMGWLRIIDMTNHESKHSQEVRAAVAPVAGKVDDVKKSLAEIKEERIYFNYKQTSWDIQALEAKLARDKQLSREDYERLTDLRTENARLKRWLERRPPVPAE